MSDSTPSDREQLQADIERTRAALGDTVEALAAKTDVKGRAQDAAAHAVSHVVDKAKDTLGAARDRTVEAAHTVADKVSDVVHRHGDDDDPSTGSGFR